VGGVLPPRVCVVVRWLGVMVRCHLGGGGGGGASCPSQQSGGSPRRAAAVTIPSCLCTTALCVGLLVWRGGEEAAWLALGLPCCSHFQLELKEVCLRSCACRVCMLAFVCECLRCGMRQMDAVGNA
jgi:hypothetical protein